MCNFSFAHLGHHIVVHLLTANCSKCSSYILMGVKNWNISPYLSFTRLVSGMLYHQHPSVFRRRWPGFQFDEIPSICTFASGYKAQFLNGNLCCIFCRTMMMLAEAAVAFPSSWLTLQQGFYSWFTRFSICPVWQQMPGFCTALPHADFDIGQLHVFQNRYLCSALVDVWFAVSPLPVRHTIGPWECNQGPFSWRGWANEGASHEVWQTCFSCRRIPEPLC